MRDEKTGSYRPAVTQQERLACDLSTPDPPNRFFAQAPRPISRMVPGSSTDRPHSVAADQQLYR